MGRIAALDPEASLGIRVIACFDELVVGGVNTRALLAAAASLAGCIAGFSSDDAPGQVLRIDPLGHPVSGHPAAELLSRPVTTSARVWLERPGNELANDAIILERLALAVRMRRSGTDAGHESRRPLALALDPAESAATRRDAAVRLGLVAGIPYRVVLAPLSAIWTTHPQGPSDVLGTRCGPVHATVVDARSEAPEGSLIGIGTVADLEHLPRSYAAAFVAVRLAHPQRRPIVSADRYGGLIDLLSDAEEHESVDADRVAMLTAGHSWAESTIEALCESMTVRQAARHAGVHHSTIQARIDTVADELGFDPLDGYGRTRLILALLLWRLRTSHAFELPPPPRRGA